MDRLRDVVEFYAVLARLEESCGGKRLLRDCHGRMGWPRQGVYFFFESGEERRESGSGLRVVRVGTHAVSVGSATTLWNRLSQHRGTRDGTRGNHRGSVFRKLVGAALAGRDARLACPHWGIGSSASGEVRASEAHVEALVSAYIGGMPLLWLEVSDEAGPSSLRSHIERQAIALLSNAAAPDEIDPPSTNWLGRHCPHEDIRRSGLWNSDHVRATYDPKFLRQFESLVRGHAAQLGTNKPEKP